MVSSRQFLHGLSRDPVLQKLDRRLIAERGVTTTPVVESLDVIEQIGARLVVRRVASAMHAFVLQAVEEALRRRVDAPMSNLADEQYPLSRPGSADKAREQCSASNIAGFPSSTD